MIVIQVGDRQVKIPQSYKELSLGDFNELWKIICKYNLDTDRDTEEEIDMLVEDEINLTKELVAKLLKLSTEDVDKMDYEQASKVVDVFNHMMANEKFEGEWGQHRFEHKGETYYFPTYQFEGMTFGEYATIKQYEQALAKEDGQRFDIIPEQMAYCCRKKGEEKESYDLKERAELFKDIKMDIVMKLTFFLHNRISGLQKVIQMCSKEQKTVQQTK